MMLYESPNLNVHATQNHTSIRRIFDHLRAIGIRKPVEVVYNPTYEELHEAECDRDLEGFERGQISSLDAVNVFTGKYTGRSPKDKFFVEDDITRDTLWWNGNGAVNDNKPIDQDTWADLKQIVVDQLSGKRIYVVDGFCGANVHHRLKVRFIMEVAWQAHFVTNMFIRPTDEELEDFEPDFVVINGSLASDPDWERHGTHSETFIAFNLTEKMQLIGGTWYGGEMKKGMFSIMNYLLPLKGVASMHCSANVGKDGDVAIFFGLSGTGKTTLSADPKRALVGDDEHGWDEDGVFNFEGGCYAKTIDLDPAKEPDIYRAIRRGALLENVTIDDDGVPDFADRSRTENTRVSYPIHYIDNIVRPHSCAGHADKVIFLTADAFGVLPPVACLSEAQAEYYFLSGFTAKLAGTERGVTEPTPTFSACFGAAFLSLHPTQYAEVLAKRMRAAGTRAYLVNTGWNGTGNRIDIRDTRAIIDAIMDGSIDVAEKRSLPIFNLQCPVSLPGVNTAILDPRQTYKEPRVWNDKACSLALLFMKNFERYTDTEEGMKLVAAGPECP